MGLFKPAWMTDKPGKEGKAVASVAQASGQAQLVEIVREAPLQKVKLAALERIEDQETLMRFADDLSCSGGSIHVYMAARKRLDAEHRKHFVLTASDASQVAEAIVDGIDDEAFLRDKVVMGARELPCLVDQWNGDNAGETAVLRVLAAALESIHDEDFLLDVVMAKVAGPLDGLYTENGWDSKLREVAVWNIADERRLYEIVCDGPTNGDARIAAVSQMNDEWNLQALVDDEEGSSGLVRYNSIGYWAREKLKRKGKIVFYTRAKPGYWEPRPNH